MNMPCRVKLELSGKAPILLKQLNLNSCFSKDIDGIGAEFRYLEKLLVANVGITSLNGLPHLPNLKEMDLSDNRLAGDLQKLVTSCPSLVSLDLSANKFKNFEELQPLTQLTSLAQLVLRNCELEEDANYRDTIFKMLPNLKFLDYRDKQGVRFKPIRGPLRHNQMYMIMNGRRTMYMGDEYGMSSGEEDSFDEYDSDDDDDRENDSDSYDDDDEDEDEDDYDDDEDDYGGGFWGRRYRDESDDENEDDDEDDEDDDSGDNEPFRILGIGYGSAGNAHGFRKCRCKYCSEEGEPSEDVESCDDKETAAPASVTKTNSTEQQNDDESQFVATKKLKSDTGAAVLQETSLNSLDASKRKQHNMLSSQVPEPQ